MDQLSKLMNMYQLLLEYFGPQGWWPSDNPFEVAVGAILTQNTNWSNVTKAITNLKVEGVLSFTKMQSLTSVRLAELIRPVGYYNLKEKRLRNLLNFLTHISQNNLKNLKYFPLKKVRAYLLTINGIGPETADTILLYACDYPSFVVDNYTFRIINRHYLKLKFKKYNELRNFFMENLPQLTILFKEFHALLVKVGKSFCKKNIALCTNCPLKGH